jgi:hypothetical protein
MPNCDHIAIVRFYQEEVSMRTSITCLLALLLSAVRSKNSIFRLKTAILVRALANF